MFVFFDIDETLLDQKQAEAAAAKHLLSAYGELLERAYSVAEFCRVWRFLREKHNTAFFAGEIPLGEQRRRRVRELFAHGGKPLSDDDADALFAFYEYHYGKHWSLFDDVLPFLESMSGMSCGIVSNGSAEQQKRNCAGPASSATSRSSSYRKRSARPSRGAKFFWRPAAGRACRHRNAFTSAIAWNKMLWRAVMPGCAAFGSTVAAAALPRKSK